MVNMNEYLNLIKNTLPDKSRHGNNVEWFNQKEKIKYVYQNTSMLEINGGIIIDYSCVWLKLFNSCITKTLIITEKEYDVAKYNRLTFLKLSSFYNQNNGHINDYGRVVYDLVDINNCMLNNFVGKFKNKNRWIHFSNDIKSEHLLQCLKLLTDQNKLIFPIYSDHMLINYELFEGYIRKFEPIENIIKINRTYYNLDQADKIIYDLIKNVDIYESIGLNYYTTHHIIFSDSCSICSLDSNAMCIYECGHEVCIICAIMWKKNKNTCPICRKEIYLKKIIPSRWNISKIKLLQNIINNSVDSKKMIIYSKNPRYEHVCKDNQLVSELIETYYNKDDFNNLEFINRNNGCLFVDPNLCYDMRNIRGVTDIIILDTDYKNIIRSESFGYDMCFDNKPIQLNIIEML